MNTYDKLSKFSFVKPSHKKSNLDVLLSLSFSNTANVDSRISALNKLIFQSPLTTSTKKAWSSFKVPKGAIHGISYTLRIPSHRSTDFLFKFNYGSKPYIYSYPHATKGFNKFIVPISNRNYPLNCNIKLKGLDKFSLSQKHIPLFLKP